MSGNSNSQSLKSVSLKLNRENYVPRHGDERTGRIPRINPNGIRRRNCHRCRAGFAILRRVLLPWSIPPHLSPELDRAQDDQEDIGFRGPSTHDDSASSSARSSSSPTEKKFLTSSSKPEGSSTPTAAVRLVRVSKWGKLSADALPEILELFYSHRTIFEGFESEDDQTGDLWQRLIAERKIDFACEGKEAGGALGIGRFRIQAHFSHQGIGMTIRLRLERNHSFRQNWSPAGCGRVRLSKGH